MRIAHLTDLHFYTAPKFSEMFHIKRIMGTVNLFLLNRKNKFSLEVQRAAIHEVRMQKPDWVIITGDLTSQALDGEFKLASEELGPLINEIPSVIIGGNHDLYVKPTLTKAMQEHLGEWMGEPEAHLHSHGDVCALHVETCKPDLLSRGVVKPETMEKAAKILAENKDKYKFTFLCVHYPVWNRRGENYGPWTRAIKNGEDFAEWIKSQPINAVIHGHEHHGYRIDINTETKQIISLNPGSSGYALDQKRDRRAHFNIYTVEEGRLAKVERFRFKDSKFEPEPEGAYKTGR